MEDNLYNDKLEEFLKNSFEQYSEDPPGDLWDRIDEELGPASTTPVRTFRWWWVAAAAAVVLGVFMCQHFYFSRQIDTLSRQLEQNEGKLKELEQARNAGSQQKTEEPGSLPQAFEQSSPTDKVETTGTQRITPATSPFLNFSKNKNTGNTFRNTDANNTENTASLPTRLTPNNTSQLHQEQALSLPFAAEVSNQKDENVVAGQPAAALAVPGFLPFRSAWLLTESARPKLTGTAVQTALPPSQQPGNFSIGIHAMPMATWEKITSLRPAMPHQDRKVFNEDTRSTGETFYAGLTAEYKTAPRFYLGSGLDYRKTAISSSHRAELRFKDRRPHGGVPHGQHQHDFQYDLNTATGLVEIEVRAEQADTTMTLPDNEEIHLDIHTRQDLQYLSVPLYGRYELGKGKLRFYVRGGLIANFLLDSDFKITDIASENPHLRFDRMRQPRGTQQNLQTISMDYLAGIGVDYALTGRLKLRLEPTFSGSLTSNHNNRFIRSSQYSAGVNAGVMYVF